MTTYVVAQYRTKPEHADEVAAVLAKHGTETVENEPGCLRFAALRSVDDPTVFHLQEEYVDDAAFEAHRETPHFLRNIRDTVVPLLEERTWSYVTPV